MKQYVVVVVAVAWRQIDQSNARLAYNKEMARAAVWQKWIKSQCNQHTHTNE